MNKRRRLIFGGKNDFPSEYRAVKYIESAGAQYIDTNVLPSNNLKIIAKFAVSDVDITSHYLFGAYSNARGRVQFNYIATAFCGWGAGYDNNIQLTIDTSKHTITAQFSGFVLDDTNIYTPTSADFTRSATIFLFARNDGSTAGSFSNGVKLYSAVMYSDNSIIRRFVPCYRKSDGEIGLYDLCGGGFYGNDGEGSFIKGPDI